MLLGVSLIVLWAIQPMKKKRIKLEREFGWVEVRKVGKVGKWACNPATKQWGLSICNGRGWHIIHLGFWFEASSLLQSYKFHKSDFSCWVHTHMIDSFFFLAILFFNYSSHVLTPPSPISLPCLCPLDLSIFFII